jgi:hypothetical protein
VAAALETQTAEVNLRSPPPLERPLRLERDGASAQLLDDELLVADGVALDSVDIDAPDAPSLHEARDADARYPYYDAHAFPSCFVCGPDRDHGDGLCIYPGPLEGRMLMACLWSPHESLAGPGGTTRDEIVWAALDCPGGNTAHYFAPDEGAMVLARLRGHLERSVMVARPHIVMAWPISRDGRKHHSATMILDASGEPCAWADTLWIELREQPD